MKTLKRSLADYCRTENKEYLLTQWDTDANGDLSPETVSYGSSKAVGGTVLRDIPGSPP